MELRIKKFLLFYLLLILVGGSNGEGVESSLLLESSPPITTVENGVTKIPNTEIEAITSDLDKDVITYNVTGSEENKRNNSEISDANSEIENIFHVNSTETNPESVDNLKNNNYTVDVNNTKNAQARISEEDKEDGSSAIGVGESAAILAGVVVLMGIAGYVGFVVWRRYLQYRYGTSEMLIMDDVYDITDLRNFEI